MSVCRQKAVLVAAHEEARRIDDEVAALGTQRGLLVTGDWPQFDLAEWLALRDVPATGASSTGTGQRLMDWLIESGVATPASVAAGRAS